MFVSGPFFTILDPQRRYVPGLTAGDDPGLQVSTISCAGAMTAGSGLDTIARNTSVQMRRRPSRRPKATPSCRISLTRSTYLALAATSDDQRCASPPPIKPPCGRQAGHSGRKGALKIIRISFLPMCPILPTPPQSFPHNIISSRPRGLKALGSWGPYIFIDNHIRGPSTASAGDTPNAQGFAGSMFRFPLRTEAQGISSQLRPGGHYTVADAERLFASFQVCSFVEHTCLPSMPSHPTPRLITISHIMPNPS